MPPSSLSILHPFPLPPYSISSKPMRILSGNFSLFFKPPWHQSHSRLVSTARRQAKVLRPTPVSSAAAGSKFNALASNIIVYNPPPSAPTPYHTPPLFLPQSDPRRTLLLPSYAVANPYVTPGASLADKPLPPPLREPYKKQYHLTEKDIQEMRRLRANDEWTWTRKRLADKFGCTEFFVGMCIQASDARLEWARQNLQAVKERWGDKRKTARMERAKRRVLWNRDV